MTPQNRPMAPQNRPAPSGTIDLDQLTGENLEAIAAEVHQAYLDQCDRLGWPVRDENRVPYSRLPEQAKRLDQVTVATVLNTALRMAGTRKLMPGDASSRAEVDAVVRVLKLYIGSDYPLLGEAAVAAANASRRAAQPAESATDTTGADSTGAEPSTALMVADDPKTLRETLCIAEAALSGSLMSREPNRLNKHLARLNRLIDACDEHRPLGPDGKHDDRHTATCGCWGYDEEESDV